MLTDNFSSSKVWHRTMSHGIHNTLPHSIDFSLLQKCLHLPWSPPSLFTGYPRVNWPRQDAVTHLQLVMSFKNVWAYTSTPTCFHNMHRANFPTYLYLKQHI